MSGTTLAAAYPVTTRPVPIAGEPVMEAVRDTMNGAFEAGSTLTQDWEAFTRFAGVTDGEGSVDLKSVFFAGAIVALLKVKANPAKLDEYGPEALITLGGIDRYWEEHDPAHHLAALPGVITQRRGAVGGLGRPMADDDDGISLDALDAELRELERTGPVDRTIGRAVGDYATDLELEGATGPTRPRELQPC